MTGYIDGIDFVNMESMRYYACPNTWTSERKKELTTSRVFSGQWIGSRKMDGFFSRFIKDEDGNMFIVSRSKNVNGEYPNKIEWLPQLNDFFTALPNGTCIIGELYFPDHEGSNGVTSVLNCLQDKAIQRQEKDGYLHWYPFDVLAYHNQNIMNRPIKERIQYLDSIMEYAYSIDCEYVDECTYIRGEELWSELQKILANGGEGMVITHEDCKYQPGKRPSKETLKCKKELTDTIDCFIMGAESPTREYNGKDPANWRYWYNFHTGEKLEGYYNNDWSNGAPIEPVTKHWFYDWAGSLILGVMKDGKEIQIGRLSGISEDILSNWEKYVNKVVEVSGMETFTDDNGNFSGIRHPRLISFREDKNKTDCLWENL